MWGEPLGGNMSEVIARWRIAPATVPPLARFPHVSPRRHQYLRHQRRQFSQEQHRLWDALQNNALAVEFYRVVAWDGRTLDFFSLEARLGICISEDVTPLCELSQDVLLVTISRDQIHARFHEILERLQGIITARIGVIPWPAYTKAVTYDPATNVTTEIPHGAA